jgi:hypothetical protein
MATTSIECSACGAAVPYGRLSCPECGELLASVAGPAVAADGPMSETTAGSQAAPSVLMDPNTIEASYASILSPETPANGGGASSWSATSVADRHTPGAYVPPAPPDLPTTAALSTAAPAPARAWAGVGAAGAMTMGVPGGPRPVDGSIGAAPATAAPATTVAGRSLGVGAVDAEKVGGAARWLVVIGAALVAIGFLLPWSNSVIGATGIDYFDRIGLAGRGHLVIAAGVLATLALALIRNPLPLWLRIGIPGLSLGSLLIGLVWVYVFGPLRTDPGAQAVLVGAVLLVVGGLIGVAIGRHGESPSPV